MRYNVYEISSYDQQVMTLVESFDDYDAAECWAKGEEDEGLNEEGFLVTYVIKYE